ncbi:hypothetical protein [Corynebacterium wankanglinii]|uniref:Uncharacterized protein n=1 Tax=Corynebacterium wankanglinii TaxID=2735136 RepID=A0A838CML3_9CORY|nr:hypothetical protein [Corynebacterium wankanglinii]MBA1836093.1 hypothetical protein [Corynebacterium wankanglinii]
MKHYFLVHCRIPDLGGELLKIAELEEDFRAEFTMLRKFDTDFCRDYRCIFAGWPRHRAASDAKTTVAHPGS